MSADRQTVLVQLRDHLDNEMKCHKKLLDLAESKQRHIVSGDMQSFGDILKKEQEPLTLMMRLRQTREKILRDVADSLGLGRDSLRLSIVIDKITGPLRDELRTRMHDLKHICERLRDTNDSNMVLIRQSLGFVRDILGVLVGEAPSDVYDRRGAAAYMRASRGSLINFAG